MLQNKSSFNIHVLSRSSNFGDPLKCVIYLSEDTTLALKYDRNEKVVKIARYEEESPSDFEFFFQKMQKCAPEVMFDNKCISLSKTF